MRINKYSILKISCALFFFLIVVEVSLRIAGFFYLKYHFPEIEDKRYSYEDSPSFRIVFIGDSWTAGADADKGEGYANTLIKIIKHSYPRYEIQGYNYAYPGINSSQTVLNFLNNYKKIRPHLLIVLIGTNDDWNSQDIVVARERVNYELGFLSSINNYDRNLSTLEYIKNEFLSLRVVKLLRILYFNLLLKYDSIKPRFSPLTCSDYSDRFYELYDRNKKEMAREYLIKNRENAEDYDEFFKLILNSFDYKIGEAREYLKRHNLWHPQLLKEKQYKYSRNIDFDCKVLKHNLRDLKFVCEQNGIDLIAQSYPHKRDNFSEINECIREAVQEFDIPFVDQYRLFAENLNDKEWDSILTRHHLNTTGHYLMAKNLYQFIIEQKIRPSNTH